MARKQSKGTKEVVARVKMICVELDAMLRKLPPSARITMGDLARDYAERFQLHEPDVRAIIGFYFHTKYAIGEQDFYLTRGRTGGIQAAGYRDRNRV